MLYLVWRVESVGIRYPWWICGTPYPLCGSHGEALWQRWLCNDKVVFVMMCWGDHLEVLIQHSRALISPGVCMTLTHTIFIMVLLSDTYYSDLSSLALFLSKTCLNERGNFWTLLAVWKQSCFVITGLVAKAIWQRQTRSIKRIQMFTESLEF